MNDNFLLSKYGKLLKISGIVLILLSVFTPIMVSAATPETQNQYIAGDIQFCPKGKPYEDDACWSKWTELSSAINDAYTAAQSGISGTIYIESGTYSYNTTEYSGGIININGFDYGTSLTIQGGVNGGTTTFVRELRVKDNADLDLSLSDVTLSTDHAGVNDYGFQAQNNTGKFTLSHVVTLSNYHEGIYFPNHTGDVTLEDIVADANRETNIHLNGITGNVVMTDVQATSSTTNIGINITTVEGKKGVNLNNITATDNTNFNLYVNDITSDLVISNATTSDSVNQDGIFILNVHGKKGVNINNTEANSNHSANIDISAVDSAVSLTNVTANGDDTTLSIFIHAIPGSKGIVLNGVTANGNVGAGISIYDVECGANFTNVETLTNGDSGITLYNVRGSKGAILKGIDASGNNKHNITAGSITGNISLSDVTANNSATQSGIYVENTLNVALNNVTANDNNTQNIHIAHLAGDAIFKTVTSEGAKNNEGIYIYNIEGKKGVSLTGVNANGNTYKNILITTISNNMILSTVNANDGDEAGIEISGVNGTKGVTLTNVFANGNSAANIYISTIAGNAVLKNIEAKNSPNSSGLTVSDIYGTKGVSITTADTSGNKNAGLTIQAITGSVKLSGITSNSTDFRGIEIGTINGTGGLTLSNVTADDNDEINIHIAGVTGSAKLSTVHASGSVTSYGMNIYNIQGSKGLTLNKVTAENNHDRNISINTITNNVSIKSATANSSGISFGLYISNVTGSKGVKINDLTASLNYSHNLMVTAITGDVNISGVEAMGSQFNRGVDIDNVQGTKGVSIKNGTVNDNNGHNIYVSNVSPGNVTLVNVNANGSKTANGGYFKGLDGTLMVIASTFNENNQYGLFVTYHTGMIMLKSVEGSNNVNKDGANLASSENQLVCSSTFNENATGKGIYSEASGYSITVFQVSLLANASPYGLGGTTVWNENTRCAVIPVP